MRAGRVLLLLASLVVAGCPESDSVYAIDPDSGVVTRYSSRDAVPAGDLICRSETDCPPTGDCETLDETDCSRRSTECEALYVESRRLPPECSSPTPPAGCETGFVGCVDRRAGCAPTDCAAVPPDDAVVCPDGTTLAGMSDTCVMQEDGSCGYAMVMCPPCTMTTPDPGLLPPACMSECEPGSSHPVIDQCGNVDPCVCVRDACDDGLAREMICGPGQVHPVQSTGCIDLSRCVDVGGACDTAECPARTGPMGIAPSYPCGDGTMGGGTGACLRNADGTCEWESVDCVCAADACSMTAAPGPVSCGDGSTMRSTCVRTADGASCGWSTPACPAVCPDTTACETPCREGWSHPVDADGCEDLCRCESDCTPDRAIADCGPGYHHPSRSDGSVNLCSCVADASDPA